MNRFYCPHIDFSPSKITIHDSKEIHHIKNVLKLNTLDQLIVFNGQGEEIQGVIESLSSQMVTVKILQRRKLNDAERLNVILACAIPKKSKFETIIEKVTELGVDQIIPMHTQRTQVVLKEDRHDRKINRYQTVAINAAKQSQRLTVPVIHPVTAFTDVIKNFRDVDLKLIPCLNHDRRSLTDVWLQAKSRRSILILIGPEGDFTPIEVTTAMNAGYIPTSLGETTLKVDTAAMVVVAFSRLLSSTIFPK